jgi:adenylate cyclase
VKIRGKAVVLFVGLSATPVLGAVALLGNVNQRAVRVSERTLQAAVLTEVAAAPERLLEDVELDVRAVGAIFARAAAGKIKDEAALAAAEALVATRETVDAIRFEVPEARVSTLLRRENSDTEVPASTAALRRLADERGVAFAFLEKGRGLVVARVPAPPGSKAPAGYVVASAHLDALDEELQAIAKNRFGDGDARLLIAAQGGRVVASWNVPGASPGGDVTALPVWTAMPKDVPWSDKISVITEHAEGGTPMVGALESVPRLGWAVAVWRPQSVAYAALSEMRRNGAIVALAAALVALLAALFAVPGVTAPVLALAASARLIGKRRWRELPAASPRDDEIGELSRSIAQMAADLERGEEEAAREAKLRGDLGRFMSKPLVDAIVRGDHPLALGGKRANVSVLFADVVGFTPLAEARSAEQVVAILNDLFSVLSEIVFRHEGTVDKFIGDCLMAVFGAPVPQEDHAARALAAAEDMMRFLEAANDEWREKYDVEVRLGIGVNSGEAIVGNIGSDKRMEYTVIGDVVNVAARLESIAQPNQVLVAESTCALVGDRFVLQHLGDRRLTGRKTETAVYALDVD